MAAQAEALAVAPPPAPIDHRELERKFRTILMEDPENPDARFVLGMLAHREGRHESSADHIARAVAKRPDNPDFHRGLGSALMALGRLDEAVESFRRAVALRPDPAALHGLGQASSARDRRTEAAQALAHAGVGLAREGRLDEAAGAFLQALRISPADADFHNELGIVHARQGRLAEAIDYHREAIRLKPDFPDAHNNLGNALRLTGRQAEAIERYREAIRLRPSYPEAFNNLAIVLKQQGKLDEAIVHYQQALHLRPTYPEAHNNLGLALVSRGKLESAVASYQQAVRLRPDYVDARSNLADALSEIGRLDEAAAEYRRAVALRPDSAKLHKNLGINLAKMEKYAEAEAEYLEAVRLRPDYADAYNDLGIVLARQDRFEEAEARYREALQFRPGYAEALNNLGNVLRNAGRFQESLDCYDRAVKLKPHYADAHNNLGIACAEMGRYEEAIAAYTQCLRLRPHHVDAHLNRSLTWLRMGNFVQGWPEYEWRWRKRSITDRPLIQPLWNGSDPKGLRILLISEQGHGDAIQFVRYAAELKKRGATTILECPPPLMKLMARCPGVDQVYPRGQEPPDHDVHCPLLTLPGLMGASPDSFPRDFPYFRIDAEFVEAWQKELRAIPGFKVGVNWQGNPGYAGDRHRSARLEHMAALARVPGVTLISLQKNHGSEQIAEEADRVPVIDLGSRLDNEGGPGPFLETAAVMLSLDLFVTCDTAVAHLAGALGVRTWLAASAASDWRWLTGREDSPWYPSIRLYRQPEYRNWPPVFERMAADLEGLAAGSADGPAPGPMLVETSPGELIDKIAILEIKSERVSDPTKSAHVRYELAKLVEVRDRDVPATDEIAALSAELKTVNEALWRIEDDIRACEARSDFGDVFVDLARRVYATNDERARLKRTINERLRSRLVEEKCYSCD